MLLTTTPTVENRPIRDYKGVVVGEAIMGANVFRDLFASIRDIVGGRSGAYEKELAKASSLFAEKKPVLLFAVGFLNLFAGFFLMSNPSQALLLRRAEKSETASGRLPVCSRLVL